MQFRWQVFFACGLLMLSIKAAAAISVHAQPTKSLIRHGPLSTTQVQFSGMSESANALLRHGLTQAPTSPEWRLSLARIFLDYCVNVSRNSPRNSPKENDWVSGELNSLVEHRIARVVDSVEFSRWTLTQTFDECVQLSKQLASREAKSATKEAVLWIKLIREFNDVDGLKTHAARIGLLNEGKSDIHAIAFLGGVRLQVIERAILPLLESP